MRREALFTTQYLAGLSMLILPQLAACLLAAIVELSFLPLEDWGAVLPPLLILALAQSGLSLFFFSFASFCAMFTPATSWPCPPSISSSTACHTACGSS